MIKITTIIIITFYMLTLEVFAYPNFIGKGYHACLTCHYNPFGNGPLNDYGRGVAATALSGNIFSVNNEKLSEMSGFLFSSPDKSFIKPALDIRQARLDTDWQSDENKVLDITMQADLNVTALFGKLKDWIVSFTYGTIPAASIPNGLSPYKVEKGDSLSFSREHYVGKRIGQSLGVYLGKMDKVFGIRVPDHTAFSRKNTRNTQYDSTHGVVAHFGKEKFDAGVQYFIGDLEKEKEYRSNGFAGKFEYSIMKNLRMGVSYQNETFDNKSTMSTQALLGKMGIGKGSSIMTELGFQNDTSIDKVITKSQYLLIQNHILLRKGLYFLMTFEHSNPNTEQTVNKYRMSPGIQWFPIQRVELRADITNSKTISTTSTPRDTWQFLGQLHLWF